MSARRGEELAVRADGQGLDRPDQSIEGPPVSSALDVPQPDLGPVGAVGHAPWQARRGGGPSAIGADRHALDRSCTTRDGGVGDALDR